MQELEQISLNGKILGVIIRRSFHKEGMDYLENQPIQAKRKAV